MLVSMVMLVSLSLVAGQADYCQISPQHTLCQYQVGRGSKQLLWKMSMGLS